MTKRQIRGEIVILALVLTGPLVLIRLAAARRATHDGVSGVVGAAVNGVV